MIHFGSLYSNVTSISYGNISATKAYLGYIQVWPVTAAGSNILEYTSIVDLGQYYHWIYNKNSYPGYFESAEAAEAVVSQDLSYYYQEPFDVSVDRTAVDSSITTDTNPYAGTYIPTIDISGYLDPNGMTVPDYLYTGTVTLSGSADTLSGYLPPYITRLSLPSELTTISAYALSNKEYLEYVDIPESVTTIGAHAFEYSGQGCAYWASTRYTGLTVHIPYNTTIIPESCFENSYINKTTLSLPDSITDVSANAFNMTYVVNDSSILTVTMPANLQRIGNSAFDFGDLIDPSNNTDYADYGFIFDFSNCTQIPTVTTSSLIDYNTVIKVPSSLYNDWITTGNWPHYSSYIVPV